MLIYSLMIYYCTTHNIFPSPENKASETRITQLENDCSTLRMQLQEARAQMRMFSAQVAASGGDERLLKKSLGGFSRLSGEDLPTFGGGPPSPLFSEDMGPASPVHSLGLSSPGIKFNDFSSVNPTSFPPAPINVSTSPSKFSRLRDENQNLR